MCKTELFESYITSVLQGNTFLLDIFKLIFILIFGQNQKVKMEFEMRLELWFSNT